MYKVKVVIGDNFDCEYESNAPMKTLYKRGKTLVKTGKRHGYECSFRVYDKTGECLLRFFTICDGISF